METIILYDVYNNICNISYEVYSEVIDFILTFDVIDIIDELVLLVFSSDFGNLLCYSFVKNITKLFDFFEIFSKSVYFLYFDSFFLSGFNYYISNSNDFFNKSNVIFLYNDFFVESFFFDFFDYQYNFYELTNITFFRFFNFFLDQKKFNLNIIIWSQLYIGLFLLYFVYYDYFNSNFKLNEKTNNTCYTLSNLMTEVEKEFGSIDDFLISFFIFLMTFFWYFLLVSICYTKYIIDITLIVFSIPNLYYMIVFIPTFLLYDFGIFFLFFIRGSAPSASLLYELMYDYIAIIVFYIRLLVQNVRIILIIAAVISFNEYLYLTDMYASILLPKIDLNSKSQIYNFSFDGDVFYYFFFKVPSTMLYFVYELSHLFFVVTCQFVVFLTMIFWLFLFFFTFFVFEAFEKFFKKSRLKRRSEICKLLS